MDARRLQGVPRDDLTEEWRADMRYLPHTDADRAAMLARIGVAAIDDLFADVPADKRLDGLLDLPRPGARSRSSACSARMAAQNVAAGGVPFFVGAGAYRHHVPASVDHLIQRSEFLTSYTPYQPEIAQGTLQYLFEFQTQVAQPDRHGGRQRLHVRRLDRHRRGGADGASPDQAPQGGAFRRRSIRITAQSCDTMSQHRRRRGHRRCRPTRSAREAILDAIDDETSCVVVQSPSFYGQLIDLKPIAEKAHAARRAADRRRSPRPSRSAPSSRRARRAPTSSSARASRSATRSPSAAPMSACSRRARNTSARCRDASPARPSMPRAAAASC